MGFTRALYYPWIEIQNEQWLRSACLYWEHLHTIVPASFRTPYRSAASREIYDAGILSPVLVQTGQPEIEALEPDLIAYADTEPGRELILSGASAVPDRQSPMPGRQSPMIELVRLHPEKLPQEVRNALRHQIDQRGWLKVPGDFADFYMTLLANRLAEENGYALLTASGVADRLSNRARAGAQHRVRFSSIPDHKSRQQSPQATQGYVVDLVLNGFSISPDVSITKILAFRRKHSDELGRLRTELSALATSVPADAPLGAIRQHAEDLITNQINPAVADLRSALKGSRIKTAIDALLKISALSAAPTSALVLAGLAAPVAICVAAGISVTATAVTVAVEKHRLLRENPFSYLLAVQNRFG